MNEAKEKALEYIKSKIPFSAGFYIGDMEDEVIKGIEIAIKETVNDRDRSHDGRVNTRNPTKTEKEK